MKSRFDFDNIKKREPYTVPDGFLETLDSRIINRCTLAEESRTVRKPGHRTILSLAAAIVALLAIGLFIWFPHNRSQSCVLTDVDQAFASMSDYDRDYVIESYQNDLFITD